VICGGAILLNQQFSFGEFSTEGMTTLALTLGIIRVFWQAFEWFSRTYVLTDRRVIRIKGVLQVEIFQCPLNELDRTVLLYSFRERLFGLGTISFTTDKSVYPSAYWLMIRRPINVHRTILETIQRYGR